MSISKHPLVSIIIPTYNRADLIGETLNSVIAQTYENWECIVVDDGSTDNTEDIVNGYEKLDQRIKFYQRPPTHKPGGCGSRNYGFSISKGELVNWFDDDDIMLDKHIKQCVSAVQQNHLDILIARNTHFGSTDKKLGTSKVIYSKCLKSLTAKFITGQIRLGTPTLFFRRNVLEEASWDEDLVSKQDYEFIGRLLISSIQKSLNFSVLENPTILIRKHKNSISNRKKGNSHLNEFYVSISLYTKYVSIYKMEYEDRLIFAKKLKNLFEGIRSRSNFEVVKLMILVFDSRPISRLKQIISLILLGSIWKINNGYSQTKEKLDNKL